MSVAITGLYSGLFALILVGLNLRVVSLRLRGRVPIGYGDNKDLRRAIRVHGNFIENVPICLILMALMEMSRVSTPVLHAFGVLLLVSRLWHAYGLAKQPNITPGRRYGMVGTYLFQLGAALLLIWEFAKTI